MSGVTALQTSLQDVSSAVADDMSERDIENLFLESGFYTELGYEGTGVDIRSEQTLPDNRRPDYITLDQNESVTAVYEFKTSGRDLDPHTDQLFHYMDRLRAGYGILTNGEDLRLYDRDTGQAEASPLLSFSLDEVTEAQARDLYAALQKREWDLTDPESMNDLLSDLDPVPLDDELGQTHFLDTFRLEEDSPFADLEYLVVQSTCRTRIIRASLST